MDLKNPEWKWICPEIPGYQFKRENLRIWSLFPWHRESSAVRTRLHNILTHPHRTHKNTRGTCSDANGIIHILRGHRVGSSAFPSSEMPGDQQGETSLWPFHRSCHGSQHHDARASLCGIVPYFLLGSNGFWQVKLRSTTTITTADRGRATQCPRVIPFCRAASSGVRLPNTVVKKKRVVCSAVSSMTWGVKRTYTQGHIGAQSFKDCLTANMGCAHAAEYLVGYIVALRMGIKVGRVLLRGLIRRVWKALARPEVWVKPNHNMSCGYKQYKKKWINQLKIGRAAFSSILWKTALKRILPTWASKILGKNHEKPAKCHHFIGRMIVEHQMCMFLPPGAL